MTLEQKNKRNKKIVAEYDVMVQTLNPRKVYMELGKKYKLDWQHIIRIVKAAKQETNFSS